METVGYEFVFSVENTTKQMNELSTSIGMVTKQLSGLGKQKNDTDKVAKTAQTTSAGFKDSLGSIMGMAKGLLIATGVMKLFGAGISAIKSGVPMIGQAFDQMGTIINRNLFYPLAKAVLPVIMDLLRWVRENRTGFVQLGTVLAGAFNLAVSIVRTFLKIVTTLFSSLSGGINSSKKAFTAFTDYLNLLLLKVAFIFTFIEMMLEPFLMKAGGLFKLVGRSVMAFFSGFMEGYLLVLPAIQELLDLIGELLEAIGFTGDESVAVFKWIGKGIALYMIAPFILLVKIIKGVVTVFEILQRRVGMIFATLRLWTKQLIELYKDLRSMIVSTFDALYAKIAPFIPIFKKVGEILVTAFVQPFQLVKAAIELIMEGLNWIVDKFKGIQAPEFLKKFAEKGMSFFGGDSSPVVTPQEVQKTTSSRTTVYQDNRQNSVSVTGAENPQMTAGMVNQTVNQNPKFAEQYKKSANAKGE